VAETRPLARNARGRVVADFRLAFLSEGVGGWQELPPRLKRERVGGWLTSVSRFERGRVGGWQKLPPRLKREREGSWLTTVSHFDQWRDGGWQKTPLARNARGKDCG